MDFTSWRAQWARLAHSYRYATLEKHFQVDVPFKLPSVPLKRYQILRNVVLKTVVTIKSFQQSDREILDTGFARVTE